MKKPCIIPAHIEDELFICVTFSKLGVISQRHHCSRGRSIYMPFSLTSIFHSSQFSMHGVKISQSIWLARSFPKTFVGLCVNLVILTSIKLIVKLDDSMLASFFAIG